MASELHMAQLELDASYLMRVAHDRGWLRRHRPDWDDLGYLVHQQLAALFQDLSPQPFRAVEQRGRWLGVLGYTGGDQDRLKRSAGELARPSDLAACRLESLRTKPMPTSLFAAGRVFGFEVRTCPVVRLAKDLSTTWCGEPRTFRRGAELDAYLHDRFLHGGTGDREAVYVGWLRARLAGSAGVELHQAGLQAFRRVRLLRRGRPVAGQREVKAPERPDALLAGTLEVKDPQAFRTLLAKGVGRHRAFGFGMLLLRPAG